MRNLCWMMLGFSLFVPVEAFALEGEPIVTIVPTGALSINILFEDAPSDDVAAERDGYVYPSLWLGARAVLGPEEGSDFVPFASLGLEVEPHSLWDGRTATYYIPTLRLGTAWIVDGDWRLDDLRNLTFLPFHAFGSVGVRSRSLSNRAALRVGAGVNMLVMPFEIGFVAEFEEAAEPKWGVKLSMGF